MAAQRRVRWECPAGVHPAVLGPSKPRRENIVRYCLDCSKREGKLVERVAPTLAAKRTAAAERAEAKRKADAEKAYRRKFVVECVDKAGVAREIDVPKELAWLCRLPAFKRTAVRHRTTADFWRDDDWLTIRRRRLAHVSGRAWHRGGMIVTVPAAGGDYDRIRELLLHELVHIAVRGKTAHDEPYKRLLMKAAFEAFPEIRGRVTWDIHEGAYILDRRITDALHAARAVDVR